MIDYMTCSEMARRWRAERDRQVMLLRSYGLTLEQVSFVIGISLQAVHKIEKRMQKVCAGGTIGGD
jgi:hypothetical protein